MLFLTPLGQLINTYEEFEQLMNFIFAEFGMDIHYPLGVLAETYNSRVIKPHNSSRLGALMLIDALKVMRKVPMTAPRTLSTTVPLLDPLRLVE